MQFGDIDYMIRQKDFTYDPVNFKGLPEFVRSIKKDGLRYIIILVSFVIHVYFLFLKELLVLYKLGKPEKHLFTLKTSSN